ncbi:MAG TPA: DUF3047 domain-containing protein [Burkholderiales bacterium]|nr:DUF3047 domain-containing protein [Burkholderiales bacterium]
MTTRRWHNSIGIAVAMIACCVAVRAWAQADMLAAGAFSALKAGMALPENWKPLGVSSATRRTRYTLVDDSGVTVVRAEAYASASGLSRNINLNPTEYPNLKWRWKIANVLKSSDIRSKKGDDYPARVYVMFDYPLAKLSFTERTKLRLARALHDPNLPAATLCYVWDGKAPAGTIVASSYTNLVRIIVVESGASRVNQWLTVERDVAADFKAAFGDDAPPVSAVAIATDTDGTGESALAFYGDISFYKHRVTK